MHILFISPAFPPFPGGGERYAESLATRLVEHGCRVTVVTSKAQNEKDLWRSSPDPGVQRESRDQLEVYRCPIKALPGGRNTLLAWRKLMVQISALPIDTTNLLLNMARKVPAVQHLESTVAQLAPNADLLHTFNISWEYPIVAGWKASQVFGKPFVVTPFMHLSVSPRDRVARNSTMAHQIRMLKDAHGIFTLTEGERKALIALGSPPGKVITVGSGTDPIPNMENGALLPDRMQPKSPYVMFIGRLSHDKGALHAVDAVASLRRQGVELDLVMVGQITREFEQTYANLDEEQKSHISVHGILGEKEKHALLSAAQMLVLPSRTDSLGIVLLEAWAHAKPVIGARAGGIVDVIDHGENGLLVNFGDVKELAQAIHDLMLDQELRDRLGANGLAKVTTKYNWDVVGSHVHNLYTDILASPV